HLDRAFHLAPAQRSVGAADLVGLELGLLCAQVDLLEQAAFAAIVDLRLVISVVAEGGVALEKLAALAQLAVEDAAQIARVFDDVRRQDDQKVLLEDLLLGALEQIAENRDVAEKRNFLHAF